MNYALYFTFFYLFLPIPASITEVFYYFCGGNVKSVFKKNHL